MKTSPLTPKQQRNLAAAFRQIPAPIQQQALATLAADGDSNARYVAARDKGFTDSQIVAHCWLALVAKAERIARVAKADELRIDVALVCKADERATVTFQGQTRAYGVVGLLDFCGQVEVDGRSVNVFPQFIPRPFWRCVAKERNQ